MSAKPDFKKSSEALEWARTKYLEREQDLLGAAPPLEQFLMVLIEIFGSIDRNLEKIHKSLDKRQG